MILVNKPLLNGREKELLLNCIDTGWISSEGPYVFEFEKKFSAYCNRKAGIAVANGSGALDITFQALRLPKGSEVIMPAFTIISCATAILRAGLKPVLVDMLPDTWNMNPEEIEKKITPSTRAILVVHLYGLPADMEPIQKIAEKHSLVLVEDAAEMHGQTYKNQICGSFGKISIFSFYPNKHITTGEGGMIVTDDSELEERCRSIRNLCFQKNRRFVHEEMGYNYRMTNLQAALGLAQLERIEEFIRIKRNTGQRYLQLLENKAGLILPLKETGYAKNIFWVFGILIKKNTKFNADTVMQKLREKGIDSRPFFWPMHKQPVFQNMGLFINEVYPVSEYLADYGFYLPSGLGISNNEIEQSAEKLIETIEELT